MNSPLPETNDDAQRLLAALVESSDDAIIGKTLDGTILTWNQGAERLFGYTAEEAKGKSISILFPADRVQEEMLLISKIAQGERVEHFETVRKRKDGTLIDISLTLSPIRDRQGKIVAASKVARDITAKKHIAHAEARLRALIESSDDAIISKDLSGTITSWNKGAERIFGYTADEVVGGPISVIIPPERGQEEIEILEKIRRGERIEHFATERIRKDGSCISVSVTISPLIMDGQIVGASKVARDITAQKQLEADLERQRAELAVTLSSIGDGVVVSDVNGRVKFLNPVAETLTGWTLESAMGQPLEAVFNVVHETTRRRVDNPALRALREGTVVGLANHSVLVARNGTEYAIDDSASPIRDATGNTLGVILVFRDVSGPRAAEDSRAHLAAIVQSSDDAIISKDLTGKIMSWNPGASRLFGYAATEVIGRPISIIIPPDRLGEETEILSRIRRGERVDHIETVRLTKDHRKINLSITISPLFNAEGRIIGASKVARDITVRKQMEAELVEARQRLQKHSEELEKAVATRTSELKKAYQNLESFTYSVAHDLQAPARRMRALATIIEEELGSMATARQREVVNKTKRTAESMIGLITDVMKLSQVGEKSLERRPTSLKELAEQAITELQAQTQGRKVEWRIGELPVVECDGALMRQVLINLISNALKFTRSRPVAEIEIGKKDIESGAAFYVRDNGVGFDLRATSKLFAPFERFHEGPEYEGSGIGLSIVERVIRRHGGDVWAKTAPNQGATFYFTLGEPKSIAQSPPDVAHRKMPIRKPADLQKKSLR